MCLAYSDTPPWSGKTYLIAFLASSYQLTSVLHKTILSHEEQIHSDRGRLPPLASLCRPSDIQHWLCTPPER